MTSLGNRHGACSSWVNWASTNAVTRCLLMCRILFLLLSRVAPCAHLVGYRQSAAHAPSGAGDSGGGIRRVCGVRRSPSVVAGVGVRSPLFFPVCSPSVVGSQAKAGTGRNPGQLVRVVLLYTCGAARKACLVVGVDDV